MLTPADEARLRDRMTVELCAATTPLPVWVALRREERAGRPVYDPCPDVATGRFTDIQPRDQIRSCPVCGERVVARRADHVFCSRACQKRRDRQSARVLLLQRYPAGQAS